MIFTLDPIAILRLAGAAGASGNLTYPCPSLDERQERFEAAQTELLGGEALFRGQRSDDRPKSHEAAETATA
jgi:hypothetical protein